ncbi:MAG TPA: triose-phosphate isomerase [candidate division Zixibacteria bacterium]|nr:triose-phosphate isomerase [candidate division Zixibacteria bacterium]
MNETRKQIIAGNWKMNLTAEEAVAHLTRLDLALGKTEAVEVLVAPSFVALTEAHKALRWSRIRLLGQNMSEHAAGAYTGEVSGEMLLTSGCVGAILGHSERRQLFGEDNELIGRKVVRAFSNGLFPVICVGETESERDAADTERILAAQLSGAFPTVVEEFIVKKRADFAVAYEPVWAIGTGKVATPEMAETAHRFVRGWLTKRFSETVSLSTRILYGGSVKPDNAAGLLTQANIDGALVGGASLVSEDFFKIIQAAPGFPIEQRAAAPSDPVD